jgi:hypothetical protein
VARFFQCFSIVLESFVWMIDDLFQSFFNAFRFFRSVRALLQCFHTSELFELWPFLIDVSPWPLRPTNRPFGFGVIPSFCDSFGPCTAHCLPWPKILPFDSIPGPGNWGH